MQHFSSRIARAAAGAAAALILASCHLLAPRHGATQVQSARYLVQPFDRLPQIADAEWRAAWPAWSASCAGAGRDARRIAWQDACQRAASVDGQDATAVKAYVQNEFDAYRIESLSLEADPLNPGAVERKLRGLITGYYEPLLQGSRAADERFAFPLYRVPGDLVRIELAEAYPQLRGLNLRGRLDPSAGAARVLPYWTREQIEGQDRLRGSELVWVDDALAAFFLQVQGSGRVQLSTGEQIRLAYADTNGQPYRSIGRWLVEQGEMSVEQASLAAIREWARAHPERLRELLNHNPSVVFFREAALGDPERGPVGALGIALTPGYSVAVDPRFIPLGAPLIIESEHPMTGEPLVRPVLAQDTGGAIRGPLRLDLFWGFGPHAEEAAGQQRGQAAVWILVPRGQDPQALVAPN